jgi:hypothetical protein
MRHARFSATPDEMKGGKLTETHSVRRANVNAARSLQRASRLLRFVPAHYYEQAVTVV